MSTTIVGTAVRVDLQTRYSAWERFMQYCAELDHGRLEKVEIANGVPVFAERVAEKVKFT